MANQFSLALTQTLTAAMDRIVPQDDFPSASQAGGLDFLIRLFNSNLSHRWGELTNGLDAIDRHSQLLAGDHFSELSEVDQDRVLSSLEIGDDNVAKDFFHWLIELVTESYYADPGNGGNRDAASWKMIGYDPRVPGYPGSSIKSEDAR